MKILLLNRCHSLNGIWTMGIRMAQHFQERGDDVYFIKFGNLPSKMEKSIAKYAKIISCSDDWWESGEATGMSFDWTHSFAGDSLLWCMINSKKISFGKRTTGIYHPRQFLDKFPWGAPFAAKKICTAISNGFATPIFMNEATSEPHKEIIKCRHIIIPLPANTNGQSGTPKRGKIVSIGRLVSFKNYHQDIIEAVSKDSSKTLTYHIIGDGPEESRLREIAKSNNATDRVLFYGQVPYEKIHKILFNAWLFTGMGTALIEASACGIPSLVAIESTGKTYGLFSNFRDTSVGEQIEGRESLNWEAEISKLLALNEQEYDRLKSTAKERASLFSCSKVFSEYKKAAFEHENTAQAEPSFIWGFIFRIEASLWTHFGPKKLRHK